MINYYESFMSLQDKSNSKYYTLVFNKLKEELKNEFNLTIINEKYINSEFCVYNSKVNFKIKEMKGWIFEIHFDTDFDGKYFNKMYFDIFWKYELFANDFKPETCFFNFCISFSLDKNKFNYNDEMINFTDALEYIKYYPYLAIYRDIYDIDFNVFYVSKYKAKKIVKKEIKKEYSLKKLKEKYDKICLKWLKNNLLNKYKNEVLLIEKKNGVDIKYQLFTFNESILNENNEFEFFKYRLWFKNDLMSSYNKLKNKLKKNKTLKRKEIYYTIPFNPFIFVKDKETFIKLSLYNKNINL